jgi:hypothetical protein
MVTMTVTSLSSPLVAAMHDEEEGSKDETCAPCNDLEEKHFETGGPLWCGIWCFLMHVVMGVVLSSFSFIPEVGETPALLRIAILGAALLSGALDHTPATSAHKKLDHVWQATMLIVLLGVWLFLNKLYTVLPTGQATGLVWLLLIIIAAPRALYKKATGKEAPVVHSEIVESLSTWAGITLHVGNDTAFAMYYILCWKLMGSPLLIWGLQ